MVFNDTSIGNGLIQECERITGLGDTGISNNATLLKDFTARLNSAKDRFYALAFEYDALWELDDTKQTDLPIATTNLVLGQRDYLFASELLAVDQVFVKNPSGIWNEITAQDDKNAPNAYIGVETGTPTEFELVGNSILLYPIPSYNSTLGLKVTFKRNGPKFSSSDGSVDVGIPSLFHPYLAREACLSYLIDRNRGSKNDVAALIVRDEETIKKFVANRAKPKRAGLRVVQENNR